ncbi:hypothetical protein JCM10212_005793 [Sporobolomyces blumeae]
MSHHGHSPSPDRDREDLLDEIEKVWDKLIEFCEDRGENIQAWNDECSDEIENHGGHGRASIGFLRNFKHAVERIWGRVLHGEMMVVARNGREMVINPEFRRDRIFPTCRIAPAIRLHDHYEYFPNHPFINCTIAKGEFDSKPVTIPELEEWLKFLVVWVKGRRGPNLPDPAADRWSADVQRNLGRLDLKEWTPDRLKSLRSRFILVSERLRNGEDFQSPNLDLGVVFNLADPYPPLENERLSS